MTPAKYVTDVNGQRRQLVLPHLGEGLQGRVYALEGGRLAVKVLRISDQQQADRLASQIQFVQRLNLERLRVARPRLLLHQPVGYVMDLVQGKEPLARTLFPPNRREDPRVFYARTGGIERRYAVMADLGEVLLNLHAQALVYGDLSPNNVFIPEALNLTEIHLIDADNIRGVNMPGRALYTPRYGAPEVVRGESGNNEFTDAYAFAVMAFEYLTLQHPLIGDRISQGTVEEEQAALAGHVPWIGEESGVNASSRGVPRTAVLTDELWELFGLAFGPGLHDPFARPTMHDWVQAFRRAARLALRCPECGLANLIGQAKWCGHRTPAAMTLTTTPHDPERETALTQLRHALRPSAVAEEVLGIREPRSLPAARVVDRMAIQQDVRTTLSERDLGTGLDSTPLVELWLGQTQKGLRLHVQALSTETLFLYNEKPDSEGKHRQQALQPAQPPSKIQLREGRSSWTLHLGSRDRPHYAVHFDFFPEKP